MTLHERLKAHYDKLLHIAWTFVLVAFADIWLPAGHAVTVVITLQLVKTLWNIDTNKPYRPWGDWAANTGGYLLYWLYWILERP